MDRETAFWSLPGPARFVGEVVAKVLSARRGLVGIALPAQAPQGLLAAVRESLLDRGSGRVVRVRAGKGMFARSIAHGLAHAAGVRDASVRTVSALAAAPEASATTFLIDGIAAADWPRWSAFLRSFAAASSETDRTLAPVLAVCRPLRIARRDAAHLFEAGETAWRGCVSPLDMRMHVGLLRSHHGAEPLLERVAAETVVRVALWDPSVAEALAVLDAQRLVDPEEIIKAVIQSGTDETPCWENGLADLWDGRPAIHVSACRGKAGAAEIRRRVWAAQAQHVLPFVDEVLACFVERYRPALEAALPLPVPIRRGTMHVVVPEDLEIASLSRLLAEQIPPAEAAFLKQVVGMRNLVAHHQTVKPDVLAKASEVWEAIRAERDAVPGWAWPRCAQRLEFVVGRVPADALAPDPVATPGAAFAVLSRQVQMRLAAGEDAVVDAAELAPALLERLAALVPSDIEVVRPALP
ncbi:hypothetical protein AX289_27565 [Methylorubrum populi]|nr:hypothetical protein AX289_27565 [Methylorubrum populi]